MLRFPTFANTSGATVEYGSPDDPAECAYLADIRRTTTSEPIAAIPR
jgi:prolyl oligopeptidase PreP (S9A serine peptidase family)